MKTKIKRFTAVIMAVIICLNIAACSNAPKWEGKWKISDADYEKSIFADSETKADNGTRTVTLTCEDSSFKSDLNKDSIRISAFPFSEEELDTLLKKIVEYTESSSDEAKSDEPLVDMDSKEIILTDYSFELKDDNTLELKFKEPKYDYSCLYQYHVHKEVVKDKVFVIGTDFIDPNDALAPKAEFVTKLTNGEENPEIEIKLENAKPEKEIKAEDITFSGAIKDLKVTSAKVSGDSIKIETEGTVNVTSATYAYVELSKKANDSENAISASADVPNLDGGVDNTSYSYKYGLLSFDVLLSGIKLEVSDKDLVSSIKIDDITVDKAEISKDKTLFKLYVKVDGKDVDDALSKLNSKTISIDSKAVGGDGLEIPAYATYASYSAKVESIDKPEKGLDKYTAVANLSTSFGDFKGLSKSHISFAGDFSNAEITSLKNSDGDCKIEFTFTCNDSEQTVFDGDVSIAKNKLYNEWGTPSNNLTASISYVLDDSKSPAGDLAVEIKSNKGLFTDIKSLAIGLFNMGKGAYKGKFADVFTNFKAIAGIFGMVDTRSGTSKKLDEIYSAIVDTQTMISNLDEKVSDVQKQIAATSTATRMGINQLSLQNSQKAWNDFKKNYINPLENTINSFENGIRSKIADYVTNSHGDELVVYYDEFDQITLPKDKKATKSFDKKEDGSAKKIDSSKTQILKLSDDCFDKSKDKFEDFGYGDNFVKALKEDLLEVLKNNKSTLDATNENAEALYDYLFTKTAIDLLTSADPNNPQQDMRNQIENEYNNFCDAVIGGAKTGSPLEEYYKIIYSYCNFQSEAEEELKAVNDYLTVLLLKYGSFASFAANINPGYSQEKNPIAVSSKNTLTYLEKKTGMNKAPEGYAWCYVVDKPITFRYIFDASYISINDGNAPDIYRTQKRYKFNKIEFKYNLGEMYISSQHPEEGWRPNKTSAGKIYRERDYENCLINSGKDSYKIKQGRMLSSSDLSIMKTRFEMMGLGKDMTFKEYLTTGKTMKPVGTVNGEKVCYYMNPDLKPAIDSIEPQNSCFNWNKKWFENWNNFKSNMSAGYLSEKKEKPSGDSNKYNVSKVITSDIKMSNFPLGEKHKLTCTIGSQDSDHGKFVDDAGGNLYQYPIDSDEFIIHTKLTATTFNLSDGSNNTDELINEHAGYGESHWYWRHDIAAGFVKNSDFKEGYPTYNIIPQQKYLCVYY